MAAARAALALGVAAGAAGCGDGDVRLFATPDSVPQTIVLTASTDGSARAVLAWSSAGAGLSYRVERNGEAIGTATGTSFTDTGLAAGQRYCWRVVGYGGWGWQARSNEACTGTAPDTDAWRVERLAAGRWPAIAIEPGNGALHACLTGAGGTGTAWLQVGPGREPQVVDADGQGACAIAVDDAGVVHVAYPTRFGVRVATRSGGAWTATTVDVEAIVGTRRVDGVAIAVGADRAPRVAYRRAGAPLPTVVIATRGADGRWQRDATGIVGLVGPRSLAVDAAGAPRLATTDELGQSAIAWRRVDGRWSAEHRQSLAPTAGDGPPIALDATGGARIAWWQRDAPTTDPALRLRWAESTAAGWRAEDVATFPTGLGTRVAIAGGGTLPWRVAAVDATGAVRVLTRAATGGWSLDAVDGQGGAADALDLAVGADAQLRVVFGRVAADEVVLASRQPSVAKP